MTRQPNVIVFLTDQQRWDSVGLHGNPLDLTPNFDRLASTSTFLPNAFTCQPVCAPARAALQTGEYPTTAGVHRNGLKLKADQRTLAHEFTDAGYDTAYIGKWHLATTRGPVPPEVRGGYDYWLGANALEFTSDAYDTNMYDGDGNKVHLPGYRVDACVDAAIDYVAGEHDKPFFLFLSIIEPHQQNHRDDYPAPHGYRERYDGRYTPPDLAALGGNSQQHLGGYWGMVKRIDEALGRMADALESLGLRDNTVLAFTTDHGCHFKTRNAEYKRSEHEASTHIPMMVTGPGFEGGHRPQELVSLIDLPPTLLDAAGIAVPERMQGRSFLPLVQGKATEWPDEVFVQISESGVARAVRTQRWKYAVHAPDVPGTEAGADQYVEKSLYDLLSDPYELNNLIGIDSHRETCDVLQERLVRRMIEAGEARPRIESAPPVPGGQRRVTPEEARS